MKFHLIYFYRVLLYLFFPWVALFGHWHAPTHGLQAPRTQVSRVAGPTDCRSRGLQDPRMQVLWIINFLIIILFKHVLRISKMP